MKPAGNDEQIEEAEKVVNHAEATKDRRMDEPLRSVDPSSPKLKSIMDDIYVGYKNTNPDSPKNLEQYDNLLNYRKKCIYEIINCLYSPENIENVQKRMGLYKEPLSFQDRELFSEDLKKKAFLAIDKAFAEGKKIVFKKGMFFDVTTTDNTHLSYFMQPTTDKSELDRSDSYKSPYGFSEIKLDRDQIVDKSKAIMKVFESDPAIYPLLGYSYKSADLNEKMIELFKKNPLFKDKKLTFYENNDIYQDIIWSDKNPFIGLSNFLKGTFPKDNSTLDLEKSIEKEENFLNFVKGHKLYEKYLSDFSKFKDIITPGDQKRELKKKITEIEVNIIKDANNAGGISKRKTFGIENEFKKSDFSIKKDRKSIENLGVTLGEYLYLQIYGSVFCKELKAELGKIEKKLKKNVPTRMEYLGKQGGFYAFFEKGALPVASKLKDGKNDFEEAAEPHFELFECMDLDDRILIQSAFDGNFVEQVDASTLTKDGFSANCNPDFMKIYPEEIDLKKKMALKK